MKKVLFITGTNSGFGKATVELFAARGWAVAATVRRKGRHPGLFENLPNVRLYELDIDDFARVGQVASAVIEEFRKIDVVVNNAGYCLMGPTETSNMDQIEQQFRTNTLGTFAVTKAFIPHMREAGGGIIINLASASALFNYPFVAAYGASKWAVRGMTESLGIELAPFNIQVKAIYPGLHATKIFTKLDHGITSDMPAWPAYKPYYDNFNSAQAAVQNAASPDRIARVIWRAATDPRGKLHVVAGRDAKVMALVKSLISTRGFQQLQARSILKPISVLQSAFLKFMMGRHVSNVRFDMPADITPEDRRTGSMGTAARERENPRQ